MRTVAIILLCFLISSCGFKPLYKLDGGGIGLDQIAIDLKGQITYEIKEELQNIFNNDSSEKKYVVVVEVKEEMIPIIINENGTVSKYQIDIALYFEVYNENNDSLFKDVSVGFAQYDVLISEIENEDLRIQMLKLATNDAASLMIAKIQSQLSFSNDN